MDLLVTLIGNAVVDPVFRKRFLDDPVHIADHYHFRLTKGEFELMNTVFAGLEQDERKQLEHAFAVLEDILYARLPGSCTHPCAWSIFPPPELRAELPKAA